MEIQVKLFLDRAGNTLTVWFSDPQAEHTCEETSDEVILMKDRDGRVIGFEKLNFATSPPPPGPLHVTLEAVSD